MSATGYHATNQTLVYRSDMVPVELRFIPTEGPPGEPIRRFVSLPPYSVEAVVFGWNINDRAGDFRVEIDPDNVIPEIREENNTAFCGGAAMPQ